jgi:hypothetical protein
LLGAFSGFANASNSFSEKTLELEKSLGKIYLDGPSMLEALGYTEKSIMNVPQGQLIRELRSLPSVSELRDDGTYIVTFGSDSTGEPKQMAQDVEVPSNFEFNGGAELDLIQGKACIIVAIWDYPYPDWDLPKENAYNTIMAGVSGPNTPYVYWHSLTNSEATWYYVWAWITWACASYENVDLYLLGHGAQFWWGPPYYPPPWEWVSGYCCYDCVAWWGGLDWSKMLAEWDIKSYYVHPYDYSTLRVGYGDCCYGYGFEDDFLNPGGAVTHDRAFTGPEGVVYTDYSEEFGLYWKYWWYTVSYSSWEAYCHARDEAADKIHADWDPPGTPFSYAGATIWA